MAQAICFDFDGVLYSYVTGFHGVDVFPDPPVDGAAEACWALQRRGFRLFVCSTRGDSVQGRVAIAKWLADHGFPLMEVVGAKPKAVLYIDDRGYRFRGNWERVLAFIGEPGSVPEPWNRPAVSGTNDVESDPDSASDSLLRIASELEDECSGDADDPAEDGSFTDWARKTVVRLREIALRMA